MTEQLWQAAKLATMGELAASVAHELNNPLAIMSLRLEEMQLTAEPEHTESLEVLGEQVQRMAGLVSHLLQFSRRAQQQVSTVVISEEVDNTLELVGYLLPKRNVRLVREYATDVPRVLADRQQLRQLLLNLLVNAIDAMPQGGTLTARVRSNGWAYIEIQDTGIGIPPELRAKVWEPFFTTKPEGKGTGLGLAICHRIVKEHHGEMEIESEPGQGTLVRVRLVKATESTASFLTE